MPESHTQQPIPHARQVYCDILSSALNESEFKRKLAYLIEYDPFFIPAYLEHLWLAESEHNTHLLEKILLEVRRIVRQILFDSKTRRHVEQKWTQLELDACKELLAFEKQYTTSFIDTLGIRFKLFLLEHIFKNKPAHNAPAGTHLELVATFDAAKLQEGVRGRSEVWWNVSTVRARLLAQHQHTLTIPLRTLPKGSEQPEAYSPVDGVHESRPSDHIKKFDHIHSLILDFATKNHYALGKVSLIYLPPYKQVYRHYDGEIYLRGRKRFHLVVSCGEKSLLESGTETVTTSPGDLWFFDNKVMHRAHNRSSVPRVHVVFDCYPLADK